MSSMQYNPYEVLLSVDCQDWPEGVDVYSDAAAKFDANNSDLLADLLRSEDLFVFRRGLIVFAELGKKAISLIDLSLRAISHPHMSARNALMEGVLCYSEKLTSAQAQKILTLADDSEDLVRGKVISFIGASKNEFILEAIHLFDGASERSKHLAAYEAALIRKNDIQFYFEEALADQRLQSTYFLASLERLARDGEITHAPLYVGRNFIGQSVSANIARIIRKNNRRR